VPIGIAIVSIHDDIHALAVQRALASYTDVTCYVIEADRICGRSTLTWSNTDEGVSRVPTREGELDVSELVLIWWRRAHYPQQIPSYVRNTEHVDLINADCTTSLIGLILNEFQGTWISDPINTNLAENKLVQCRGAQGAGFKVPRTLVSQDPAAIKRFCTELDNKVVVKPVKGTHKAALLTTMLNDGHLASEESIRLCPTIYQEYIGGERHVRVQCFGDAVYAVLIESQDLDWRANLDVPFTIIELADSVKIRLRALLKRLGLKMGVVDLKLTLEGDPVFLEINPQGQFLFAEGLTGLDLTSAFANYLYKEAQEARSNSDRCLSSGP
jgi:glutathione synthase/RimK-type ligase-like ATP-grasp enzyme